MSPLMRQIGDNAHMLSCVCADCYAVCVAEIQGRYSYILHMVRYVAECRKLATTYEDRSWRQLNPEGLCTVAHEQNYQRAGELFREAMNEERALVFKRRMLWLKMRSLAVGRRRWLDGR